MEKTKKTSFKDFFKCTKNHQSLYLKFFISVFRFVYEKLERMLCDGDFIAAASSPTDCGAGTGSIMGRVGTSGDINKVTNLTGEVHNIVFAP